MKNFKTGHQFVTTRGTTDRRIGAYCSVEYAEQAGESLRRGTEYTIWKRFEGRWIAYRTREAGE